MGGFAPGLVGEACSVWIKVGVSWWVWGFRFLGFAGLGFVFIELEVCWAYFVFVCYLLLCWVLVVCVIWVVCGWVCVS